MLYKVPSIEPFKGHYSHCRNMVRLSMSKSVQGLNPKSMRGSQTKALTGKG